MSDEWKANFVVGAVTAIFVLILFGTGYQYFVLNPVAQSNREHISDLVDRQHKSDLEFCARSNDARVSSIHNLRGDVHTLKAGLELWEAAAGATTAEAAAQTPPEVAEAFSRDITALRRGIDRKQHAIHSSIEAQAPVAIHPGSPIVDCARAYP